MVRPPRERVPRRLSWRMSAQLCLAVRGVQSRSGERWMPGALSRTPLVRFVRCARRCGPGRSARSRADNQVVVACSSPRRVHYSGSDILPWTLHLAVSDHP
jgi:hypothetical protein